MMKFFISLCLTLTLLTVSECCHAAKGPKQVQKPVAKLSKSERITLFLFARIIVPGIFLLVLADLIYLTCKKEKPFVLPPKKAFLPLIPVTDEDVKNALANLSNEERRVAEDLKNATLPERIADMQKKQKALQVVTKLFHRATHPMMKAHLCGDAKEIIAHPYKGIARAAWPYLSINPDSPCAPDEGFEEIFPSKATIPTASN